MSDKACIQIEASDGSVHLLPYGHFLHAVHKTSGAGTDGIKETLAMRFAVHTVIVEGNGLSGYLERIQDLKLSKLSRSATGANITSIEVHEAKFAESANEEPQEENSGN